MKTYSWTTNPTEFNKMFFYQLLPLVFILVIIFSGLVYCLGLLI